MGDVARLHWHQYTLMEHEVFGGFQVGCCHLRDSPLVLRINPQLSVIPLGKQPVLPQPKVLPSPLHHFLTTPGYRPQYITILKACWRQRNELNEVDVCLYCATSRNDY